MTARPQQMSDGQDKSDDLIAELAKLMASSAGGAEPEAKSGPKLVSVPEPVANEPRPTPEVRPVAVEPRPASPTIRIPGMDQPTPTAIAAAAPAAERPAAPAPTIRIPGMDQPVAATPRPVAPMTLAPQGPTVALPAPNAPATAPEPKAPAVDFAPLPPANTRPEPSRNWQDRETPRAVAARPTPASEPALTAPVASEPKPVEAKAPDARQPEMRPAGQRTEPRSFEPRFAAPTAAPNPPAPLVLDELVPPAEPQVQEPDFQLEIDKPVVAARPAPEGDSFDFDFGFGNNPPEAPKTPAAPSRPAAAATSKEPEGTGDPIADLISAELDAVTEDVPVAVPARPPVQPPVIRTFQPSAPPQQPQPQQQRPLTSNPVRPPVAPPAPPSLKAVEPEADRFSTAPVFGLGSKSATPAPAPAAPSLDRDPMDEIESLIGEAVRVELSAPDKPAASERPQPAPVVPPLTTGFAPRRAAIKETEPQIASAEAAILAAAAASGAEIGRLEGNVTAEPATTYKRPKAKAEKRGLSSGMRQYVGMAVAGTLLLAAGFGLYWVLGMGHTPDGEAPVLTADAAPVKQEPPPAPPSENTQGSVVFNELGGNNQGAPPDEQLVSRDDSADTSVADVAETVGDGGAGASESELANRKVRTVTVRPDGTIVSGDDAVAGSEALPVDRPNVPAVPGADVQPSELLAALPSASTTPAATDPVAGAIDAATTGATPQPTDPANINPNIEAVTPMPRPANRAALNGGGASRQVPAADPGAPVDLTGGNTAPAAPAAPAVSAASGSYVQLSSQPTTADAQASLRTVQNRLSGLLNGRSLEVRQVDLGPRGVWYRVVLPTGSFSEATQTCASFKANGTDCVPING